MKRVLKWGGLLLLIALLIVAGAVINVIYFRPFSINLFYERVFLEYAMKDPEMLSSMRLLEPLGLHFHNDDLTDASPAHHRALLDKAKRDYETLQSYNLASQSPEQQLSTRILAWYLQNVVEGEPFLFHDYPVNQLFGVQSELPTFMVTIHQVTSAQEAEQYVTRLWKFSTKFEQLLEGLRLREEKGIIPPKFVIERVLTQMRGFIEPPHTENLLVTSFKDKINKTTLSQQEQLNLISEVEGAVEAAVYPAYASLIEYFEALEARATTDDGVWKLPDGDAFYAYCLRSQTTTSLTPEQVHQIGLEEVDRILKEMDTLLTGTGRANGTVAERMQQLAQDPAQLFPDNDDGRAQALAQYQAIIDEINGGLDDTFDLRPQIGVNVERVPQFKEKTAPGAYYEAPALDGSRPGVFYANLRDMNEVPQFGMRTLAYHEAIPGHHFQIAIQQVMDGPTFRKMPMFTAYVEGWALYAERLAWELGFQQDPLNDLGRLQAELFRAVRLVVDTGIHSKRWPREQAIEYMESTTGMPHGDVVAEIERYIVNPGQACAYKLGQLRILELRDKAKQTLGDRFNLKDFHNVILRNGAVPLEVLEEIVAEHLETAGRETLNVVAAEF